ncbi:MAG: biotin transporter BioY [Candidatus Omnitrophica bacterium]|nr:biotin transporter BioY [Candidatus Omnitrophota bacterium]
MEWIQRKWNNYWQAYFHLVHSGTTGERILLCFSFAGLIGISAQLRLTLPFTPVPVTAQVYLVLLTGILLGKIAPVSLIIYLAGGIFGIPWFSGATSGFSLFTFGYLVGFVPASFLIGFFSEKSSQFRQVVPQICLMLAGIAIIYLCGTIWLCSFLGWGWKKSLLLGVLPFIPFDLIKAYLAGLTASILLPAERGYLGI